MILTGINEKCLFSEIIYVGTYYIIRRFIVFYLPYFGYFFRVHSTLDFSYCYKYPSFNRFNARFESHNWNFKNLFENVLVVVHLHSCGNNNCQSIEITFTLPNEIFSRLVMRFFRKMVY